MNHQTYSSDLTAHDFLKVFALVFMILDHIGAFFLPEYDWLRVVGRWSAPIWMFLVGYALSRDLSPRLWAGVAIITLTNAALELPLLPICILATILFARAVREPLMRLTFHSKGSPYFILLVLFFLGFPSMLVIEYGTHAFLFVLIGYAVRNRDEVFPDKNDLLQFVVIAAGFYALSQIIGFPAFSMAQKLVAGIGIVATGLALSAFRGKDFPDLAGRLGKMPSALVRLAGRRTLEIYILHFAAFKIALFFMAEGQGSLFQIRLF
jgi:hypothetical protein